jgi:Ca-activated chloride channel family protein
VIAILSVLVLALIAALVIGALVLTDRHTDRPSAGTSSSPTRCGAGVALNIAAAPAIAPAISDIATHWLASHPIIDGACPTVVVHPVGAATEETALAEPNTTLPDVWIPDSSLWIRQLKADTAGLDSDVQSLWLYPSIASSPLVLAASTSGAGPLAKTAASGWPSALASSTVSMLDPTATTAGLLALLTAQKLLPGTAGAPSPAFVRELVGLSRKVLPNTDAGFLAMTQHPNTALAFPASEQDIRAANAARPANAAPANAVTPKGQALGLDFPVAQFAPPGGNPAQRDAAAQFAAQLSSAYASTRLRAANLRDPSGTPLPSASSSSGTVSAVTTSIATPSPDQIADGLRVWKAAGRTSRTLVVIDTSGSMADTIGGGQSKIEFASAAAHAAVDFFPDTSSLGLWDFSVKQPTDWTQLVPLGTLGSAVGAGTRRQAMVAAADRLPNQVRGNTGLYKTALAAYEAVRTGYDPSAANSVVLLTDGSNTDQSGLDLATLLSTLRAQTVTGKPLPIITIAVGADADLATLKQISAATGGSTLTAAEPSDIRGAVIDAIVRAG